MPCREEILSQDTYDYITDYAIEGTGNLAPVYCDIPVGGGYHIVYVDSTRLPGRESDFFAYQTIPKLYGLMQEEIGGAMDLDQASVIPPVIAYDPAANLASGITQIQYPPLSLTGEGVIIGIIDTGIDFTNPAFRDEAGRSRILSVWDQSVQTGSPPEGFLFGTEYSREELNAALTEEAPFAKVPTRDDTGHGTAMASVAAGSTSLPVFQGSAPGADLVVVKLKEAKKYLRDLYLLPEGVPAYQENDIMLGVKYCLGFVRTFRRPVVICLGLGTSLGDHNGSSPLSSYLNQVALERNVAVVAAGGNEGNNAHHYRGNLLREPIGVVPELPAVPVPTKEVELRVGDPGKGFYLELWGNRPDILNLSIRSPGGEVIPPLPLSLQRSFTYGFLYEKTKVTIDVSLIEASSGDELIRMRFQDPTPGIWTIRVLGWGEVENGTFDLWLPITQFIRGEVYFLNPDPDITMTEPAMAFEVIAVTAYDPVSGAFYVNSGRGYSRLGRIRPDLCAPGVEISTIDGKRSGSSYSAALTAGAVAQFLQWAVVQGNNPYVETREIKSYLIRGAKREKDITYPSREWGYGRLDMVGVFESLRV